MEVGLNTSINASAVSSPIKVETQKTQVAKTEKQESNVKLTEDSNKISNLKEGNLKVKTISLSSDEPKKGGLSIAGKIMATGGTVVGVVGGGITGIALGTKLLPQGRGSFPNLMLIFAASALVGGVIGGVTAGALVNKK